MKEALIAIGTTAREVLRNPRTSLVLIPLYVALLASLYLFVSTREATLMQLVITALAAVAAPVLFFLLQGAGVSYAGTDAGARTLLRRALRTFWKLFIAALPLVALGVLAVYLLGKLQARYPLPDPPPLPVSSMPVTTAPPPPLYWQTLLFPALRLFVLGIMLPLAAIHLWISIAREGFVATLKRLHRVVARAYTPASMLVYTLGLVAFAFIPYFLIFKRTTVESASLELVIFGLRLALAFVFTFWGWLITLGALTRLTTAPNATQHAPEAPTGDASARTGSAPLGDAA